MVLEHLFPEEWLERKSYYAFFLGAGYSILGIILARFLFAADPALPAVAFTSLLLLPELYKMFSIEEKQQSREKAWGLRAFWRDNGDFYRVFLFLFLGILLVYSVGALVLDSFSVNTLFREQMELRGPGFSAAGMATSGDGLFLRLLENNFWVLVACFVVALLAGDGAIFLIVWNASVWGTIFGVTARNAAFFSHSAPLKFFVIILFTVLPHVLLEASSYILAAIAGGLISKGAIKEGINGKRFGKVFRENAYILVLALVCLVLGALVESLVLQHSESYSQIVRASYLR
jgi:uncharacterized membrane protein SpoIIM required for sporulation